MFEYSQDFKDSDEWDSYQDHPEGSVDANDLREWARDVFRWRLKREFPLKPQLKKSWSTLINGRQYPELWIRYYAILRHCEECMVLCSDYANHATESELPIVRNRKLDLKLLLAHAQIQHWDNVKKQQTKKGQTNGQRKKQSIRRTIPEMAGA